MKFLHKSGVTITFEIGVTITKYVTLKITTDGLFPD